MMYLIPFESAPLRVSKQMNELCPVSVHVRSKVYLSISGWMDEATDRCSCRTGQCPLTSCARGSSGSLTACRSSGEERKAPLCPDWMCCSCPARVHFLFLWPETCDLQHVHHRSHCPSPPRPAPDLAEHKQLQYLQLLRVIEWNRTE